MAHIGSYNPDICDLCGEQEYHILIENADERGLASGSQIVKRRLKKIECCACGLVRDGVPCDETDLTKYYFHNYPYNTKEFGEEHVFFTQEGPLPRSEVIQNWILELKPENQWGNIHNVLEVGCGQGNLLVRLSLTFPDINFEGVELGEEAVNLAKAKGLNVSYGSIEQVSLHQYDMIICFGVLEHVPSPTLFLQALQEKLSPGGEIISGQPMQDTGSYDIFYVDHLHHFKTTHITLLSQKVGLFEKNVLKAHPILKNFSLHLFEKIENPPLVINAEYEVKLNKGEELQDLGFQISLRSCMRTQNYIMRQLCVG